MLVFVASSRLPAYLSPIKLTTQFYTGLMTIAARVPLLSRWASASWASADTYHLDKDVATKLTWHTVARFLVLTARSYVTALAFHINTPFEVFLVVTPLALLSLIVGFIPGGLGIADLSLYTILVSGGVMNASDATLFVVGSRAFNVASLALLTLVAHIPLKLNSLTR